ncbi:ion transporter [Enterovibrio sp. ZSDZ35]|uniref:Ion transporter n=1 Tax=Enterovibrio qingdaonensis TaxID=2899818 RepID=A0ABT5QQC8_9GAMM|nr:ion transporter [Enterovibrio sp. ZSDZ35]MDD1783094.1 ion transporter [Enterovibrio sp. ZSDZ35]
MSRNAVQEYLYTTIFGTETRDGKAFDIALIIIIIASIVVLMAESIGEMQAKYGFWFFTIEWGFTIFFTIEYALRLYCSPAPKAYAKSFYGIVDLLAILPTYLAMLFPGTNYLMAIRLLRVLRIFRVLKLMRYLQESDVLLSALKMSGRKIFIFFYAVIVLVTIFGSLMFVIEGPEHGFTSIPYSIYWAIVTMTTVGYGDLVPQTDVGKALASITMLMGYSIIAVPTGIITAQMGQQLKTQRQATNCPNCSKAGHENDASFCKYCGSDLNAIAKSEE